MSRKGNVSFTSIDLGFPAWTIEFDPIRPGLLYCGGGGGEQKEVPNKIVVIDTSSRTELKSIAEIRIESDSASSLGVLANKPNGAIVFAQVNSKKAERLAGSNDHLRTYEVEFSSTKGKKEATGSIKEAGKTRLFAESYIASDGFGRLLRLSRGRSRTEPSKRIGVVGSSLANESELVVFDATKTVPTEIQRVKPISNHEANDVDIFETEPGQFTIAYCTAYELYSFSLTLEPKTMRARNLHEPFCISTSPIPDAFASKGRPKYRCLRFLTKDLVLLLVNIGSLSELQVVRLLEGGCETILRKRLPKSVGSAVSLDVSLLDADPESGDVQAVIAVAAQTKDVMVFTLDLSGPTKSLRGSFNQYASDFTVADVPLKQVRLQLFAAPAEPKDAKKKETSSQYIQLASISLSNNLVVDTIPLLQLDSRKPRSRYILNKPGGKGSGMHLNVIALGFMLLISLLLAQSYLSQQAGGTTAPQLLPQSWQDALVAYRERALEMSSPLTRRADRYTQSKTGQKIIDILHAHHKDTAHLPVYAKKAIVISADGEAEELSHEIHDSPAAAISAEHIKSWSELTPSQQEKWKAKLKKAGAWSANYGETILTGVFFSEIAGAVGRAAADAIQG